MKQIKSWWIVVFVFFIGGAVWIFWGYNGPFLDEAIYVTAGIRTLEGFGASDNYSEWFAGSYWFWPVVSAIGFKLGGLEGSRLFALLISTIAVVATVAASQNLFGEKYNFWVAFVLATNGSFLSLSHLGVYDVPALACIALSLWLTTELSKRDSRVYLVLAAVSFTFAVASKYPTLLMIVPLISLIYVMRGKKALVDIVMFMVVFASVSLVLFLPQSVLRFALWQFESREAPAIPLPRYLIAYASLFYSLPAIMGGIGGLFLVKNKKLVGILLGSLVIWPLFHIVTDYPSSLTKHLTLGVLFATPLTALLLARLWDKSKITCLFTSLSLFISGIGYVITQDFSWPDFREVATYVVANVKPGDEVVSNSSWPYVMYLYTNGVIDSPWVVYDEYRINKGQAGDICRIKWLINEGGTYDWSQSLRQRVEDCGTFTKVYWSTGWAVGLGLDLGFIVYPVETEVFLNSQ